jgi:hypothetical protein
MIKRLVVTALMLAPFWAQAQEVEKGGAKKATVQKPSRDFFMFQLNYEGWVKPDSIKTKGIGRGANVYLCYDFPIKKSNFSFAAGIGIGTANIYLADQQIRNTDTGVADVRFGPETTINYKRYKMTTAYLEAPFELRFFGNKENRNAGFKAAIGMRVGTLLGTHVKGKEENTKINYKENSKKGIDTWRFGATLRLGYGNFTLMGTYNLTKLYKDGQGPEITPYSIGICLTGL